MAGLRSGGGGFIDLSSADHQISIFLLPLHSLINNPDLLINTNDPFSFFSSLPLRLTLLPANTWRKRRRYELLVSLFILPVTSKVNNKTAARPGDYDQSLFYISLKHQKEESFNKTIQAELLLTYILGSWRLRGRFVHSSSLSPFDYS